MTPPGAGADPPPPAPDSRHAGGPPDDSAASKRLAFWSALGTVLLVDLVTKALAERAMLPWQPPRELLGSTIRLALAYNPGVAFGLHIGPPSRVVFSTLVLLVLAILFHMYRRSPAADGRRALALGLLCGGALGNLADRLRSPNGVVDFIDVGIGEARWWTFNVADVGVSLGAVMLAWIFWHAGERPPTAAP